MVFKYKNCQHWHRVLVVQNSSSMRQNQHQAIIGKTWESMNPVPAFFEEEEEVQQKHNVQCAQTAKKRREA